MSRTEPYAPCRTNGPTPSLVTNPTMAFPCLASSLAVFMHDRFRYSEAVYMSVASWLGACICALLEPCRLHLLPLSSLPCRAQPWMARSPSPRRSPATPHRQSPRHCLTPEVRTEEQTSWRLPPDRKQLVSPPTLPHGGWSLDEAACRRCQCSPGVLACELAMTTTSQSSFGATSKPA